MSALAASPNVVVKIGGLVISLGGFDWHEQAIPVTSSELAKGTAPYYLHCIEQFGPERCMFESNRAGGQDYLLIHRLVECV